MVKRLLKSRATSALGFLAGVLVAFTALFVLFVHTDFFAGTASRMVSRSLLGGTPFSLRFDRLSGNPFRGVVFENVQIRFDGPEFSFDLLRVDRVDVGYSLADLLGGTAHLKHLELVGPRLWIKPDSSGAWILPGGGGEGSFFAVDSFAIHEGQVIIQESDRARVMRHIDAAGGLEIDPEHIAVRFADGAGTDLAGRATVRSMRGGISLEEDRNEGTRRLVFDGFRFALEESILELDGAVELDTLFFDLQAKGDPFDIAELAGAAGIETGHEGEIGGDLHVAGRPGNYRVDGVLDGVLSGFALDDFQVDAVVSGGDVRIRSCTGTLNGARISGGGSFSSAAPGELALDLDVADLDLSAGFVRDPELPETSFTGRSVIRYETETGEIDFLFELERGHFRRLPFETAVFAGSWERDTLFADRFEMNAPGHRVEVGGTISGDNEVRLFIDIEAAREDTVFGYFGVEDYRADVRLNGLWEGPLDRWDLRMSGTCRNLAYLSANLPEGQINLGVSKGESYRVLFDVSGDSLTIADYGFNGFDLSLEYFRDVTTVKRFHLRRGGVESEMRGDVTECGPYEEVCLQDVSLAALDESWTSGGRFLVTVTDTAFIFDDLQFHSRLGAVFVDGIFDRRTAEMDGSLSFERFGLSLFNRAGFVGTPLDGRMRGSFLLGGTLDRPVLDVDVHVDGGAIDTVAVDSVRLACRLADGTLEIDTLSVSSPTGRLSVEGAIEGLEQTAEDGWRPDRAVADLIVFCDELELRPLLAMIPEAPVRSGLFTGRAVVRDSLLYPFLGLQGRVRLLEISSFVLPAADLEAVIGRNGELAFGGTIDIGGGGGGSFTGKVPLRRLDRFYAVDRNGPIELDLVVTDGNLAGLIGVTDFLAEASGGFSAGFRIGGTVADPVMVGEMTLSDASFRPAGMEERFAGVDAHVTLRDSIVTVHRLEGREGRDGRFDGRGTITLRGWRPREYDLSMTLDEILIASVPDVMAIVTGTVDLESSEIDGVTVPLVRGDLFVNRAEVYYDLGELAEGGGATVAAPSWIGLVDLEIGGNTWLRSDDANVELEGEVTLHHNRRGTYLRGELELVRGYYNVYNNKFQVTSGTLQFVHAASFRPVVDVQAQTRDAEGRLIYLDLTWLQDDVEPRLTLTHEDPGYSETDIWKMLGGGVVESGGGEGASWDALSTAQNLAANYIERILNSQMEGLTIEVESRGVAGSGSMAEQETMVAIGKYLSEGLYVKYKQGLSISTARQIEVEYRLSRRVLIRSEIIRHSEKALPGQSSRSSDEVNLDIKLRWEF